VSTQRQRSTSAGSPSRHRYGRHRATVFGGLLALSVCVSGTRAQELPILDPLDETGRVTYFIADGAVGSSYRPADRDLALWALQSWERSAGGVLKFEPGPESTALLRIYWVPANAGQYGEMRSLLVDGRQGAAVFIRPDTDALGEEIGQRARLDALFRDTLVYLTCLHELGHALGLSHTADFRDVMYFFGFGGDIPRFFGRYRDQLESRDDIAGVSGLSAGDLDKLAELYPSNTSDGD
jgi:hypothetical protein